MSEVDAVTIQLYRLTPSTDAAGVLMKGEPYIRIAGDYASTGKTTMPLGHEDFVALLTQLRYELAGGEVDEALQQLGVYAAGLLGPIPSPRDRPLQVDLVLGSAELWALPFETCRDEEGRRVFVDSGAEPADGAKGERPPLIVTRRIRQGLAAAVRSWPVRPRVLFAHAPEEAGIPQGLVQQHREALNEALRPWSSEPESANLLDVHCITDTGQLHRLMKESEPPYPHVHILAHGKVALQGASVVWGLRLNGSQDDVALPEPLMNALLRGIESPPSVITLCACDSANQAESAIPKRSLAQELHAHGVPVVIASQLPLTLPGSATLTRAFYEKLFSGHDVRLALHAARQALGAASTSGHDWASLVGYVQLPEGYDEHLLDVGVQVDMEILKAARRKLDAWLQKASCGGGTSSFDEARRIQDEVQGRVTALERRLKTIPAAHQALRTECRAVLASAYKRLAEVHFRAPVVRPPASDVEASLLRKALEHYRGAHEANLSSHWAGVQQLSLGAVLSVSSWERSWGVVRHAAELELAHNPGEYWAQGTLAELHLLKTLVGSDESLLRAREALEKLVAATSQAEPGDRQAEFAVASTRDQLGRYVDWWTKEQGYFEEARTDLSRSARKLLEAIPVAAAV